MEIKKRKSQKKSTVKLKRGTPRGGGMGIKKTVRPGYRQTKRGKRLGSYNTRAGALKRERQVNYYKHKRS